MLFLGLEGNENKVFVVGLNKTGTSSLGETLRDLGHRLWVIHLLPLGHLIMVMWKPLMRL